MKISGKIIQNRNIEAHTEDLFDATYKGFCIYITTDHGCGRAKWGHLKRFKIDVWRFSDGISVVDTYEDKHTIRDAIRSALEGACLL